MDTVQTDLCDLIVTLSSNKVISSLLLWTSLEPFIFLLLYVKDDKLIKKERETIGTKWNGYRIVCREGSYIGGCRRLWWRHFEVRHSHNANVTGVGYEGLWDSLGRPSELCHFFSCLDGLIGTRPNVWGFSIALRHTHTHTHSVGLLWMIDQRYAETCTW